MECFVSSSDLAKVLKLTAQRVNQLAKEGTVKREVDGKFYLPNAINDYYSFKYKTDEDLNFMHEHTLLEKAKREKAEIELEQLKSKLLYASDVEQAMANMIKHSRAILLPIAEICAVKLIGQKNMAFVVEIIREEIYCALNTLKDTPLQ